MDHSVTLKELCGQLGVSRRTIQGYEKAGIFTASGKNKYGHLLYDEAAQKRAAEIRLYQELGFRIKEIHTVLAGPDGRTREMLCEKIIQLTKEKEHTDELIRKADALIKRMDEKER